MRGLGTIINLLAVAGGGIAGLFLGDRLPERVRETTLQGLGLISLAVGITGLEPLYDADEGLRRFVILIAAIVPGGIVGELARLEDRVEAVGERLRARFHVADSDDPAAVGPHPSFVEGFVIASTVFCVGPLSVLGALDDGLGISIRLLAIKSALDGFAAVGFAAVYGVGVLASLITIAIYQGAITATAALVEPLATTEVLAQLGAVGSLLVIAIGLKLLDIVHVRIVNLMPALLLGPVIAGVVEAL